MEAPMKLLTALIILSGEGSPLEGMHHELALCRQRLAKLRSEEMIGLNLIKLRVANKKRGKKKYEIK